jgi:two-component system, response regulator
MTFTEPWLLLVEDSVDDRELALLALDRGHLPGRVESARDGVEALDRLRCRGPWADRDRDDRPCAVMLDVTMPRLDGVAVLRELKADPELSDVPVVMLTSSAEEADLVTCYGLGANSYVVKPVDIEVFFQTVLAIGRYWLDLNRSPQGRRHGITAATADR